MHECAVHVWKSKDYFWKLIPFTMQCLEFYDNQIFSKVEQSCIMLISMNFSKCLKGVLGLSYSQDYAILNAKQCRRYNRCKVVFISQDVRWWVKIITQLKIQK